LVTRGILDSIIKQELGNEGDIFTVNGKRLGIAEVGKILTFLKSR
jgi:hypothetical protein